MTTHCLLRWHSLGKWVSLSVVEHGFSNQKWLNIIITTYCLVIQTSTVVLLCLWGCNAHLVACVSMCGFLSLILHSKLLTLQKTELSNERHLDCPPTALTAHTTSYTEKNPLQLWETKLQITDKIVIPLRQKNHLRCMLSLCSNTSKTSSLVSEEL